jgi:hypothetical protein
LPIRVERSYQQYSERLERYRRALEDSLSRNAKHLIAELNRTPSPSEPLVYGYQMLPVVENDPQETDQRERIGARSYSWPITQRYIAGENTKIDRSEAALKTVGSVLSAENTQRLATLVREYRE